MLFMVLVKGDERSEAGILPSERVLTEMGKYHKGLARAGAIFGREVLYPSSKGARVRFSQERTSAINGPFGNPQELLAGYWHLEAESLDEAIEFVKRMPFDENQKGEVEIRQVLEMEGFAPRFSWME
jgi:hypothetical protein